jgi:4-hydroxybenzoate polyprenyltransferase
MFATLPRSVGLLNRIGGSRPAPRTAAPLLSWTFVRAYVTTMRPYLFFVSGITGLLGMALGPAVAPIPALALAVLFFLAYGFGQALTDCSQTDTDAISAPYRPLTRGLVSRRDVMAVSLVGLVAIGTVLTLAHTLNLALVGLSIAGLATYTWFKRRWWGGPFYNAWIVAVLLVIGLVAASGAAGRPLRWPAGATAALAATFFGYANFVLAGYFKDIAADRATGYQTLPVVFGRRDAAVVSDLFATAAVVAAALAVVHGAAAGEAQAGSVALLLLTAGAIAAAVAQVRLHRVASDDGAHGAIGLVVHAYILLLAGVAAAFRPDWGPPLLLFYAVFVLTLRLRPMRQQI